MTGVHPSPFSHDMTVSPGSSFRLGIIPAGWTPPWVSCQIRSDETLSAIPECRCSSSWSTARPNGSSLKQETDLFGQTDAPKCGCPCMSAESKEDGVVKEALCLVCEAPGILSRWPWCSSVSEGASKAMLMLHLFRNILCG